MNPNALRSAAQPEQAGGVNALTGLPNAPQPYTPSYSASVLGDVSRAYPRLAQYAPNTAVQWGQSSGPEDDRQLEFYQPWEGENPNPGKNTVELFNKGLKGQDITDSVALDMLHHVGAMDPSTNQPVDPQFYAMKKALVDQISVRKAPWDVADYQDNAKYGPMPTWDDYLMNNRADAYIRAAVSPRMNPGWDNPKLWSPEMQATAQQIKAYLASRPGKH